LQGCSSFPSRLEPETALLNRFMSSASLSRRFVVAGVACGGTLLLSGCESTSDFNPNAAPRARAPGVPVALVSIAGAPETVITRVSTAIARQAQRRDILIVGIDGQPRYQVRGYLSAHPSAEGGSEFSWVFDLFDAQKRRAQRVAGRLPIRGAGGDNWVAVTETDIERMAFNALDEIASFLADAPPAAPVAAAPPAGAVRRSAGIIASQ
jgi:hypothetical protein